MYGLYVFIHMCGLYIYVCGVYSTCLMYVRFVHMCMYVYGWGVWMSVVFVCGMCVCVVYVLMYV